MQARPSMQPGWVVGTTAPPCDFSGARARCLRMIFDFAIIAENEAVIEELK